MKKGNIIAIALGALATAAAAVAGVTAYKTNKRDELLLTDDEGGAVVDTTDAVEIPDSSEE